MVYWYGSNKLRRNSSLGQIEFVKVYTYAA